VRIAGTRPALLADGTAVLLRPIRPDDAPALAELNEKLSSESRYMRYFSFRRELGERELERFTHPDGRLHAGIVAFVGAELVGHACFDRKEGEVEAEVGFEVADAYHGRGLGTLMLEALASHAWSEGVTTFVARVLPYNTASLAVFRDLGLEEKTCFRDRCVHVSLDLMPTGKFRAAARERHAGACAARSRRRSLRPASAAR
jgi:RimJ/RimL family protein N-acetyltransferase